MNDHQSLRLATKHTALGHFKNIENIKNDEIVFAYDNFDKLFDGNNHQLVDINNFDMKNYSSSPGTIIEEGKLPNCNKFDNCETVFTKIGNLANKNGNPENSLTHSRLFSSTASPNSSVELFEYERSKDIKLNRNADCPDFLPNIVKELKCFQLSKIDEETHIYDERRRESSVLTSMDAILNNLIDVEKEKLKEKEVEKEKGKLSIKLNENDLSLVHEKHIEKNQNSNDENFLISNFQSSGIKKKNNRKDIILTVDKNKNTINENNKIFIFRGVREKEKIIEKYNSKFEKKKIEETEVLINVENWSPF